MRRICYARAVPKQAAKRRPTISIIGPGNLGTALAVTLSAAGYKVHSIAIRRGSKGTRRAKALARQIGAQITEPGKRPLISDIVWITVSDDSIAAVARALAKSGAWKGKIVLHSSGALTSDELAPLRAKGARVASVHPMMTFVHGAVPDMRGVAFALEGDGAAVRAARSIAKNLGANAFAIERQNKVLYHVFGSFASPLVIALLATMEEVALAAGIRKREIKPVMFPLLWRTLQNYLKRDAAAAFSGPLARGDVATVRKHLAALEKLPQAREFYVAMARAAVETLPVRNRETINRELGKL